MFEELKKKFQSTESLVSLVLGVAVVVVVGTVVFNVIRNRASTTEESKQEENKEASSTQQAGLPTIHTVAAGDTLWGISETYYKTGYNWPDLAKTNNIANADWIEAGQVLTIPVVTPIFPPGQVDSGIMDKKPDAKSYTIVAGDNLWDIAVAQYGNGFRWGDIAKANSLSNPDLIYPGNVLTLP